ncbi:MAG: glycosyltransferase family 2 protein [Clostridia bacterium]|nr:glycosyltransferase family 2 protein [Clostridia bacterium]
MPEFNNHTFVVCAYKESKYLEECIKSLENQSVKSNIIIATSTPNTFIKEIAKKHNLELFINEGESGIGQDWNFGVSKAKTKYVTVAHQDDIYNTNYLEEIVNEINKNKDFIIAFGDYREIKNGEIVPLTKNLKIKKFLLSKLKKDGNSKKAKMFALKFGSAICCPCVTINTHITGKKPYKIDLKCDLDWDTWYDFAQKNYAFLYINKEIMLHRIHEDSETSNLIQNNVRLEEDFTMFKKFWPTPIAKFLMKFYKSAVKTNNV